MYMCTCKI